MIGLVKAQGVPCNASCHRGSLHPGSSVYVWQPSFHQEYNVTYHPKVQDQVLQITAFCFQTTYWYVCWHRWLILLISSGRKLITYQLLEHLRGSKYYALYLLLTVCCICFFYFFIIAHIRIACCKLPVFRQNRSLGHAVPQFSGKTIIIIIIIIKIIINFL